MIMMTLKSPKTTVISILFWVLGSHAWGPITHLYLCSLAAERSGNETSTTFFSGCNSPDSLKQAWPELHSLQFAAHLFQSAVNNSTADLIDFALGFGCHVANDEVGHHANGFLNPPSADHDIEFNLDSMIFHEFDTTNTIVNGRLSEDVINLIQKSASSYHKMSNGSTAPIDRARMQSAINRFQISLRLELAMVRLEPQYLYEYELSRHSFCNVSSYKEVIRNFNMSADWAVRSCLKWRSIMWTMSKPDGATYGDKIRENAAAHKLNEAVDELLSANGGTSCTH